MAAGAGIQYAAQFPGGFALRPEETAIVPAGADDIGLPINVNMLKDAQYLIGHFNLTISYRTDPAATILDQDDVEDPNLMNNDMRRDRQGFNDYGPHRFCRYAVQTGGRTLSCIIVRCAVTFSANIHRHAFLQSMYRRSNLWLGR